MYREKKNLSTLMFTRFPSSSDWRIGSIVDKHVVEIVYQYVGDDLIQTTVPEVLNNL